jgi:hypothetical protein
MKTILLIMIGLSLLRADFTKTGDIVKDNASGLEWQDDNVSSPSLTWQDAITQCETLTLNGHDDWRLPNINELKSIVDRSKSSVIVDGFESVATYSYWSSTSFADASNKNVAWLVSFGFGDVHFHVKSSNSYCARCVRGGQ